LNPCPAATSNLSSLGNPANIARINIQFAGTPPSDAIVYIDDVKLE
jgi:hypothetical protein